MTRNVFVPSLQKDSQISYKKIGRVQSVGESGKLKTTLDF